MTPHEKLDQLNTQLIELKRKYDELNAIRKRIDLTMDEYIEEMGDASSESGNE